jgi:SAM-dependent methyltransferase
MAKRTSRDIHEVVRERYAGFARDTGEGCCSPAATERSSCCGAESDLEAFSRGIGYTDAELASVPEGANLGLGCGNPQAIASLCPGETVLDLGSGAGVDCFLAARAVGEAGRVIGVDMTPQMVEKARRNAERAGVSNVEFRHGMIEKVPVDDESVDVIMSNCVINLSPDKPAVYREAFRVLKSGGRLAISDMVATAPIPEHIQDDVEMLTGCVAGASPIADIESMLQDAGFADIRVEVTRAGPDTAHRCGGTIVECVASATIQAIKP